MAFAAVGGHHIPKVWVSTSSSCSNPSCLVSLFSEFFDSLLDRDLVPAKRRKLRKAAEVRGAAAATTRERVVLPASDTTEGPVEPSVEERSRPMEKDSTGPEEKEAERPVDEVEATVPLTFIPPEEATASSPPVEEPHEEGHEARSPTPTPQTTLPEREEEPAAETAASETPEVPGMEMEVDTATAPASQGPAGRCSLAPEACEEEEAPQGGDTQVSTPVMTRGRARKPMQGTAPAMALGQTRGTLRPARPHGCWCTGARA